MSVKVGKVLARLERGVPAVAPEDGGRREHLLRRKVDPAHRPDLAARFPHVLAAAVAGPKQPPEPGAVVDPQNVDPRSLEQILRQPQIRVIAKEPVVVAREGVRGSGHPDTVVTARRTADVEAYAGVAARTADGCDDHH